MGIVYECPTITVTQESEKRWIVYDNMTPIVGKGANREAAFKCYYRGLNLLQQKHAGIDTGMNEYLDYLEQNYIGDKKMSLTSNLLKTNCNIPMPNVKPSASNGDRICNTCNKEDVCMYKAELAQAAKEITQISERKNVFIDTDIKCKKWSGVVNNYR